MHYVTAIRMAKGGSGPQHISSVRWLNSQNGATGTSTVTSMVEWLTSGNSAFVGGPDGRVPIGVVKPSGSAAYLRTHANGQWTDNLLSLPRF